MEGVTVMACIVSLHHVLTVHIETIKHQVKEETRLASTILTIVTTAWTWSTIAITIMLATETKSK